MNKQKKIVTIVAGLTGLVAVGWALAQPAPGPMSFFLTSRGSGNGGNLGGLAGADKICQDLAQAAGHGALTWRAYLSTQGQGAVNARDRIGPGPWFNVRGARIAQNVDELHTSANRLAVFTALDERGNQIPGSGFSPNRHDILTGSTRDGRAWSYNLLDDLNLERGAMTCSNYTSDAEDQFVMVGHHDRAGTAPISPWNAAHPSVGCSQAKLVETGGAGLLYCFAID